MWVTELSIRRPLLMLMAILSVMIFGLIAYSRLGVDLFPSVEFPVVSVTVPYPGASPEVVESLVTRPVEDAVSGLAYLDSVSSTSSEGVAAAHQGWAGRMMWSVWRQEPSSRWSLSAQPVAPA